MYTNVTSANLGKLCAIVMSLLLCVVLSAGTLHAQTVLGVAVGAGTVPGGEYAGLRIRAAILGVYSGYGNTTLVEGRALVYIGSTRFDSIVSTSIPSFCCGEGHVGTDFFSMTGWVQESAASGPHSHLFGTSATKDGKMCIDIVDQTGSVVPPATPPHDPGVGLICDIPALVAIVPLSSASPVVFNRGNAAGGTEWAAALLPARQSPGSMPAVAYLKNALLRLLENRTRTHVA